jgi:hypothetical protein
MKFRFLLSFVLVASVAIVSIAQGPPGEPRNGEAFENRRDRIEAVKVSYMTVELDLSSKESQEFWPLYNEYKNKEKALRKANRPSKKIADMSDAEVIDYMDRTFVMEQDLLDLKKAYSERFMNVLPARKVAMIPVVERRFKEKVLREMRNKRSDQRNNGGGRFNP